MNVNIVEIPAEVREYQKYWIEGFDIPIIGKVIEVRFPNDGDDTSVVIQNYGGGCVVAKFDSIKAYSVTKKAA